MLVGMYIVFSCSQQSEGLVLDVQLICACVCADQEVGDSGIGAQGLSIRASPKTTPR